MLRTIYGGGSGLIPARYVRHSQMCPQLDMSDKKDKKTKDMSDKSRCVRQQLQKNSKICLTNVSDININKMQDKGICLTRPDVSLVLCSELGPMYLPQTARLRANTGVVERGVESTTGDMYVYPLCVIFYFP